ncbi:MAG TPA: hypothetical protein VLM11_01640 [Streptosporangiaceae bacterium]|nr:hypothetical protein [Streptosporangiaceae bacterium]
MTGGWGELTELPASTAARSLADVLAAPPTYAERKAARAEAKAAEAKRAAAADVADGGAWRGFVNRLRGGEAARTAADVLAEAAAASDREDELAERAEARQARREAKRAAGSGVILDAAVGVVEPDSIGRSISAMHETPVAADPLVERQAVQHAEQSEFMARYRRSHPDVAARASRRAAVLAEAQRAEQRHAEMRRAVAQQRDAVRSAQRSARPRQSIPAGLHLVDDCDYLHPHSGPCQRPLGW